MKVMADAAPPYVAQPAGGTRGAAPASPPAPAATADVDRRLADLKAQLEKLRSEADRADIDLEPADARKANRAAFDNYSKRIDGLVPYLEEDDKVMLGALYEDAVKKGGNPENPDDFRMKRVDRVAAEMAVIRFQARALLMGTGEPEKKKDDEKEKRPEEPAAAEAAAREDGASAYRGGDPAKSLEQDVESERARLTRLRDERRHAERAPLSALDATGATHRPDLASDAAHQKGLDSFGKYAARVAKIAPFLTESDKALLGRLYAAAEAKGGPDGPEMRQVDRIARDLARVRMAANRMLEEKTAAFEPDDFKERAPAGLRRKLEDAADREESARRRARGERDDTPDMAVDLTGAFDKRRI